MKPFFNPSLILAVALGVLGCGRLGADPPAQVGRLSLLVGPVSFLPSGLNEWAPATLNYPMTVNDHLWTDAGGRAEIQLGTAAVRLDSSTELSFLALDDSSVQIRLSQGSLNVKLWSLDPGATFQIDTPNSGVSLLSEGSYRVDAQPTGTTIVVARSGQAQVAAGDITMGVPAGQEATISGLQSLATSEGAAPPYDDWDQWCFARDALADNPGIPPFLPRQMIGIEDLGRYGSWIIAPPYGNVWVPAGVPAGWAPYRFGHWSWVAPWGWTWIDDAPWGFAPFHYGRWVELGARWCWIPILGRERAIYAPALVVFVGGNGWGPDGDSIGWFPLGPGELYIPPYPVGDSYLLAINIRIVPDLTIRTIRLDEARQIPYRNRWESRAVTVVPRRSFVLSMPTGPVAFRMPQASLQGLPIIGMRAPVQPQRESMAGRDVMPWARVPQPSPVVVSRPVYSRDMLPGAADRWPFAAPFSPVRVRPVAAPFAQPPGPAAPSERYPPPLRAPYQVPGPRPADGELMARINSVESQAAGVEQRMAAARDSSRGRFDSGAAFGLLESARASLANARQAYSAGDYAQASQLVATAQRQIEQADAMVFAALRNADNSPGDQGGYQGRRSGPFFGG